MAEKLPEPIQLDTKGFIYVIRRALNGELVLKGEELFYVAKAPDQNTYIYKAPDSNSCGQVEYTLFLIDVKLSMATRKSSSEGIKPIRVRQGKRPDLKVVLDPYDLA